MNQSNALRKLEQILDDAVNNGNPGTMGISILLETMKLEKQPGNIMLFYEILSKAKEEAKSIRNLPKIDGYIQTMNQLHDFFAVNDLGDTQWIKFVSEIKDKNILNTLDALANYFHNQNLKKLLKEDFLEKLNCEFTSLCDQVLKSDLPKELKRFLSDRIENILTAIRRYGIDGTDGLEKAIKSLISDLVMVENSLKDEDKKNPTFNKVRAWSIGVLTWITPTPYDLIGAVPDIHDFWIPKFEQLQKNVVDVEKAMSISKDVVNTQAILPIMFSKESQEMICSGKDQKLLSPVAENSDINPI